MAREKATEAARNQTAWDARIAREIRWFRDRHGQASADGESPTSLEVRRLMET